MKQLVKSVALLALGSLVGIVVIRWLPDQETQPGTADGEEKPLYWVAPMDPNYRRDGPGKSPMGMDLVPVYADDVKASVGSGTVEISPEVIRRVGKDRIVLLATVGKITSLRGRPLLVDTGDVECDAYLSGYYRVVTGFREAAVYRVAAAE